MNWKKIIKKYSKAPLAVSFAQFRWGVVIFFIGMVVLYAGAISLEPSLAQELVTLFGLIIIAVGFITAITAQIRMMLSRFIHFFNDD